MIPVCLLTQIVTEFEVADAKTDPPAAANTIDTATATRFMVLEIWRVLFVIPLV
jgi:hypothetical protein